MDPNSGVFEMRLQQQAGAAAAGLATLGSSPVLTTVTPTYDLGCPPGIDHTTKTTTCPFGTVHNVHKRPIGARIAAQIEAQIETQIVAARIVAGGGATSRAQSQWPGPTLARVQTVPTQGVADSNTVTLRYAEHGTLSLAPTQNCVACCTGGSAGDFDASFDGGQTWVNGTRPVLVNATALQFDVVQRQTGSMSHVRYTASQPFPQCAVYSSATLGPAMPFRLKLGAGGSWPSYE